MKKHCLECNEPVFGRSDKKFCSDDCRSRHHHKQKGTSPSHIRKINYMLKRNRSILARYTSLGKRKIKRRQLIERGFSFQFYTHVRATKRGRKYRYCYEQGYRMEEDGAVYLKTDKEL